ncbi:hypothetical protein [Streptosporangium sp. NPDC020145]|uniref:hypothetical protein n=1 Tax=Streptosporangium sp. NPDC020145 TaxID=3154694 RepID=UPI0034429927
MDIRSLEELQQPDGTALVFSPLGLGGKLTAEDAAVFQQEVIGRVDLADSVPDLVRRSFERVRAAHSYGVLHYEFFTLAHDHAQLVLEYALRERFVEFYSGMAIFEDQSGTEQRLTFSTFDDLHRQLRERGRPRGQRRWRLQLRRTSQTMFFDGMLTTLLEWARAEGLLNGERNRLIAPLFVKLRNHVAHHTAYQLISPPESARAISDLAEIVNRLWGVPTPGGRLYPAPVHRDVIAVSWDPGGGNVVHSLAEHLHTMPADLNPEKLTHVIVRAVLHDQTLTYFDARFETTLYPCQLLWGPGNWANAVKWLASEHPTPDTVDILDRQFMIRFHEERIYLPQQINVAAGLPGVDRHGTWYLVRADFPNDAFNHLRQQLTGNVGCSHRRCDQCAVEVITTGTWQHIMDHLAAEGSAPAAGPSTPDVRAPSWLPRWNGIHRGSHWTIPPS